MMSQTTEPTTEPFIIKMMHSDLRAINLIKQRKFFHIKPLYIFSEEEEKLICRRNQLEQQSYVINREIRSPLKNIYYYSILRQLRYDIEKSYILHIKECEKLNQTLRDNFNIPSNVCYELNDHIEYLNIALELDRIISKSIRNDQKIFDWEQKIYYDIMRELDVSDSKAKLKTHQQKKISLVEKLSLLQNEFDYFYQNLIESRIKSDSVFGLDSQRLHSVYHM